MKPVRSVLPAFLVLAFSAAALAADPGHEVVGAIPTAAQGMWTAITALVVFAITAAFLQVFVWPKVTNALSDRENKIKDAIDEAEMARDQAKAALEQYEKNLAQARAEAQKMLDQAKTEQLAIGAELRARSEAELNQMREKAKRDIESAKASAVIELNEHAASMATEMARKILRREINAGDQSRLISESLAEMQGSRN